MSFFSVIIPLYNKEAHILDTLKSIFDQNFKDYEIIIVNDGSTDNSWEKIKDLENSKLKTFNNENQGVSQARNFAMKQAKGDYFTFLDADDIWGENHLQDLFKLTLDYPNCGLYCTNYTYDYGNDFIVKPIFPTLPKNNDWKGIVSDFFLASLKFRIATTISVAIPNKIVNTIGYFDTNFTSGQDTDYWTRIALLYPVAFTKKTSAVINIAADNRISNTHPSKRKFMTFEKFLEDEKTNTSLKKFNDMYRSELAIKHKIVGDTKTADFYKSNIDYANINWKKKILLKLPNSILMPLWKFKQWLKTKKIDSYI
ncbi:MAG: glycosyltransferase family 2 protein [Flavobacteriaceae bacterium]|nr:glycosyltransferase family 2 protein [Flavobacteriaceae bacterium]